MYSETLTSIPSDFLSLIDSEFLIKKGRFGSMTDYYPFFYMADDFICVLLREDGGMLIGGAVIRIREYNDFFKYGQIGAVAIDLKFRNNGYSSILLKKLIEASKLLYLDKLVLWTSKPYIYEKEGFFLYDNMHYIEILNRTNVSNKYEKSKFERKPLDNIPLSKPTYAKDVGFFSISNTDVFYIYDGCGFIFYDYKGDPEIALEIMSSFCDEERKIRLFINNENIILRAINKNKFMVFELKEKFEMWLNINSNFSGLYPEISFIDRI